MTKALFDVVNFQLASAVAAAGTVTVGYPAGRGTGNYLMSDSAHVLFLGQNKYVSPKDFTCTFNAVASSITVTNKGANTWPAGAQAMLQLNTNGTPQAPNIPLATQGSRVNFWREILIDLGSPLALNTAGIVASQTVTGAGTAAVLSAAGTDATLNADGSITLGTPRNITAAWTNTAILTITGKDEYGNTVVETSASGTSHTGKKAFKSVSSITTNATITGATAGYGDILGLPIAVRKAQQVIKEMQDGAAPSAGTFAFALSNTKPLSTSADVRGTYLPAAATDGSKGYALLVAVPDPTDIGVAQFAG